MRSEIFGITISAINETLPLLTSVSSLFSNYFNLIFEGREFNFHNMPNNLKTDIEISVLVYL
jgi:hypothetical protein